MSTYQPFEITPSDSSEQLNVEEAERRALAERVFAGVRKPMSTPRYIALLIAVTLVVGFGSWGIVRGVEAAGRHFEKESVETTVEDAEKNTDKNANSAKEKKNRKTVKFGAPDSSGIMHTSVALPSIKPGKVVEIALPSGTLEKNYVLHVYAPASALNKDAHCPLRFETPIIDQVADMGDEHLDTPDLCPTASDGSVDIWLPITRTSWLFDNRFSKILVRGWGATVNFDLMEFKNASPHDWDGTSPFQGIGPAFIRTTSGAYEFDFHADKDFNGIAYVSQGLNVFEDMTLKTNTSDAERANGFLLYTDGTTEPSPGYIFIVPNNDYMDVSWTLTEIDTGDLPHRQ